MTPMTTPERLALNKYDVDAEPHIRLKPEICETCDSRPCLNICPAECFKSRDGKLSFAYEGCLECGSCRIVCDRQAIEWSYPRSGYGVCFEYG